MLKFLSLFIISLYSNLILANFEYKDFYNISYSINARINESGTEVIYRKMYADKSTDRFTSSDFLITLKDKTETKLDSSITPQGWFRNEILITQNISDTHMVGLYNTSNKKITYLYETKDPVSQIKLTDDKKFLILTKSFVIDHSLADVDIEDLGGQNGSGGVVHRTADYIDNGSTIEIRNKVFIIDLATKIEKEIFDPNFKYTYNYLIDNKNKVIYFEAEKSNIYYASSTSDVFKSKIFKFDIKTALTEEVIIDTQEEYKKLAAISPNGRYLVLGEGTRVPGHSHSGLKNNISILDLATGKKTILVKNSKEFYILSFEINSFWINNKIYFPYSHRGELRTGVVDLDGNIEKTNFNVGASGVFSPYTSFYLQTDINKRGDIVFLKKSSKHYPEIYLGKVGSKIHKRITFNSELALRNITLGDIEEVNHLSSYDQVSVQGWLVKPPDFDPNKKYPLLTYLHGGPILSFSPSLSARVQLLASKGYIVYYPNYRASTGYGHEFTYLNSGFYSKASSEDVISGVLNLQKRKYVDASRNFVFGGSAGATLSTWLTIESKIFTAATALFTSADIFSGYSKSTSLIGYGIQVTYDNLAPWQSPMTYIKDSSYYNIGEVTTPTLLISGENDTVTPTDDSIKYFNALLYNGVETELIVLKDSAHGSHLISNLIREIEFMDMWFKKYFH